MDKRKLLTRKPIVTVEFNERNQSYTIELGKSLESDAIFVSLVFIAETLAERLGLPVNSVWNQLELYKKARVTK